ncbi:MAG TPA: NAD-binding protein [Actinomycetota bacterium]|nr:NAD-binding protein [Actinomycetota bacterium]
MAGGLRRYSMRHAILVATSNLSRGLFVGSMLAGAVLVVSAVLFYFAERIRNEDDVAHIGDGFLWVTRTLLQQEPPFEPETFVGMVLYYVVVIAGVGIIAMATGAIATKLIQWVTRKDAGMADARYRDHIVICGWSPEGEQILAELHNDETIDKKPVVIAAHLEANPTDDDLTTFVRGSPSDAETLRRAGIQYAETAIILADSSDPNATADQRDAMTLLTALAVESANPNIHTCVEVIRSQNRPHFARAKVDEMIVSAELSGQLLATAAMNHGVTHVLSDLMTRGAGEEIYSVDAPRSLVGKTFSAAIEELKRAADALPIAIGNKDEYEINPPADRTIRDGERLLVIAPRDPAEVVGA